MLERIIETLGSTLHDETAQRLVADLGLKLPKKLNATVNTDAIWIESKKERYALAFVLDTENPAYPPIPVRKNSYKPVFSEARFSPGYAGELPFARFDMSRAQIEERFGPPFSVSERWLDDDGQPLFTHWQATLREDRDIVVSIEWRNGEGISDISIGIRSYTVLSHLYDACEPRELILREPGRINKDGMLVEWAIKRGLFRETSANAAGIRDVKEGRLDGTGFLQTYARDHRLWLDDFSGEHRFLSHYRRNLSGHNILYTGDFADLFLKGQPALRNNPLGEAAQQVLRAVGHTQENQAIVSALLDRRLEEHKAHGFARSRRLPAA